MTSQDITTSLGTPLTTIQKEQNDLSSLSFKTRDDYLAWLPRWKACLAMSIVITRRAKSIRGDKAVSDEGRGLANWYRQAIRVQAHSLFETRVEAKKRTVEHYKVCEATKTLSQASSISKETV